jgi:hypothetical protein
MLVFVQMSVLPPGSSIGPTFNVISVPAGVVTPSSITLAELLAGIFIDVPEGTVDIIVESANPCNSDVVVPIQYCLTTTTDPCLSKLAVQYNIEAGSFCYETVATTPLVNSKPYYPVYLSDGITLF